MLAVVNYIDKEKQDARVYINDGPDINIWLSGHPDHIKRMLNIIKNTIDDAMRELGAV